MSALKERFEHLRIPLDDIRSATNNFAEDHRIGASGFGPEYRGELYLSDGLTAVSVKRLDRSYGQGDREFRNNVIMHSTYQHENMVSLIGFSYEEDERILVYQYASKGSLDSHLGSNDLNWVRRLSICIGAARGLEYLHDPAGTQQRLPHRDIKSANILLDENWNPMISNLDQSIFGPVNQKEDWLKENPIGTIGYCDPSYVQTGILRKESDVYSFGVVLFEVLCGRLCIVDNNKPGETLTNLVEQLYGRNELDEIIFHNIKDEINPSSLKAFATIAYQCLRPDYQQRPSMKDVVRNLENARTYQIFTDGTIPLRDIELAMKYFKNKCIGEGGYGKVYKGVLPVSDGRIVAVAVKCLNATDEQGNRSFMNERRLSKYRHGNIVTLLGYCNDANEMILLYEYAANRSLDYHLNNNNLRWVQRLNICIGVARGLKYLHKPDKNQESILHLDIKSANILLDETWNAKITDFGLSKFGVANQGYTSPKSGVVGTPGYCDPMFLETGSPTKESDIYSFGMVLFEVLCGRLNAPNKYEHRSLGELTRSCYKMNNLSGIIFGNIKDEINPSSLRVFVTVAYQCMRRDPEERPSMKEILIALETALECQVSPRHLTPPPTPSSKSRNEYQRSLKPLYWETTHATVGSVWDVSYKDGNKSRAPEIDITHELESLFCYKHKNKALPSSKNPEPDCLGLIHPDRASNCNIMLRGIKLPPYEIINAILALDSSALSVDQAYDLNEFCPTNEEMEMLKIITRDKEKLGKCEKFFLECAKIPRIDSKLQVFAFTITFSRRVNNFNDTLKIIKNATKEIRESTKLAKIMQIILTLGNKLNAGTSQGSAEGFKLDSLERLGYTWATDNEITLLHFLCKVVAKHTPELLDFYKDLTHLQDAYWVSTQNHEIHIRSLYEEKSAIMKGFEKVQQEFDASANDGVVSAQFQKSLKRFLDSAGAELLPLKSLDEVVQYADSLVTYFGEDPNRYSWKQVITSLVCFTEMFKKAHNENKLEL